MSKHDESTDEKIEQILEQLDKLSGKDLQEAYTKFRNQYPKVFPQHDDTEPDPPNNPPAVPDEGRVKNWGADLDPAKWRAVQMKDDPKLWKVVDERRMNVADLFTTEEKAKYFIKYYQDTNAVPTPGEGTSPPVPPTNTDKPSDQEPKPEPKPEPEPPVTEQPTEPTEGGAAQPAFPVPEGFKTVGKYSTAFKHWGRHETNYASGGSGPSERWDNKELQALNVLSGYEINLGLRTGSKGEDNIDLKFRGDSHSDNKGGWYIPFIEWGGSGFGIGKEYPHPKTTHLKFNVEQKTDNIGTIKGNKWIGFLAAVFDDSKGVPTMMLWCNTKGTGVMSDYTYLGKSKDTGNMKPGPVLTKIAQQGGGAQSLQIRADEAPDARIRNAFAVEIEPPADA